MMNLAHLRHDYEKNNLQESDLAASPFKQFQIWFEAALTAQEVPEPNAMTLATVNAQGYPAARIVLFKGIDEALGFLFYSNYQSRKGHELAANPQASLLFFWQPLERQIRIEGHVEKTSAEESEAYFHSRPLASRISAWASHQSQPVTRKTLEAAMHDYAQRYGDTPPRPPYWGGYRLVPHHFEFWQGRPSRLHDRLVYERDSSTTPTSWRITRLSP